VEDQRELVPLPARQRRRLGDYLRDVGDQVRPSLACCCAVVWALAVRLGVRGR